MTGAFPHAGEPIDPEPTTALGTLGVDTPPVGKDALHLDGDNTRRPPV